MHAYAYLSIWLHAMSWRTQTAPEAAPCEVWMVHRRAWRQRASGVAGDRLRLNLLDHALQRGIGVHELEVLVEGHEV